MSDNPYLVFNTQTKNSKYDELCKLNVSYSNGVLNYSYLFHYCSLETLGYIINKNTFRCTSLNSASLNDQFEARRKNVECFAGSRFIGCFSHCIHEIVPFWYNYGGTDNKRKVAIKVKNFCNNIKNTININYCLLPDGKKMFFYSDEYKYTLNRNGYLGQKSNLKPINLDYNIKTSIKNISVFDIQYFPLNNEVFTRDYSRNASVTWGEENNTYYDVPIYDPTNLGKHKTEHWEYEQETRLMCTTDKQDFSGCDFIDLRLHESFFANMIIVMCPWAEDGLYNEINNMIGKSALTKEIKDTIKIVPSELYGQVK